MIFSRITAVAWLLMLLGFGWPNSAAAEEEPSSAESVSEAEVPSEGEIASQIGSSASEAILPLDHWQEISSEAASEEINSDIQGPTGISDVEPETPVYAPTPKPHYPVVGADHTILKKAQKARIEKVEKKLRAIVFKEEQARIAESNKDPRGDSEVRICSVNFNSFGTKEENARLLKKIPKPRLAKAERTIIQAIVTADCDVVAVQGIIGRSTSFALEALGEFEKKLAKKTNKIPWKFEIAKSKEQSGYQGFLIKDAPDSPIAGFKVETITDSIMKVPGRPLKTTINLKNEIVPRDFLKLTLEVKSTDLIKRDPFSLETKVAAKENREVVLINGILAKGVAPFQPDDRLLRLQIADVAVRLFAAEQSRVTPNEQPIVLAAIERVEGIMGGAQHILTGRLNIDDFEKDGVCKIQQGDLPPPPKEGEEGGEEEVKIEIKPKTSKVIDFTIDTVVECRAPLDRPQPRFDILASVPFEKKPKPAEEEPIKKAPKISKRDLELQTSGIFVVSADLKYSAKKGPNLLDSAAGRVEISNGLPGAYLVWVDLNW